MAELETIDLLVQYAIAAAAGEEPPDNQLGQLHILAYIYLADLACARKTGDTFTGVSWQLGDFGAWSPRIYERIEPAARARALRRMELRSERGGFVYQAKGESLRNELEPKLPIVVSRAIDRAVRKYGASTALVLEAVYLSDPVRRAAPGEALVLEVREPAQLDVEPLPQLTARQLKRRKQKLAPFKAYMRDKLAKRQAQPSQARSTPPRYDEVFASGAAHAEQASSPLPHIELDLSFDDSIWKSDFRSDDALP